MSSVGSQSELLNVLGDVKARVQDKLGIVDFPMPQFIIIGKQSVGKSRLIETLAGETFNFISGSLGSRRPTVLEFRNIKSEASRWYCRNRQTNQFEEKPITEVIKFVGSAHEELGATVSKEPIHVRIESPHCVDMQMVDLPGFRDFALDQSKQDLADKIQELVQEFMNDKRNVMICVEQAGDAATMSTLARCRAIDPNFDRTILVRNKLDKYYNDLTPGNVNDWVNGFGDLPDTLVRFALTLPFWKDGDTAPKPFVQLRSEMTDKDMQVLKSKQLSNKFLPTIGFTNFSIFMEKKIEALFTDALEPVMANLRELKQKADSEAQGLQTEMEVTDPSKILTTTRDCGTSFANALTHVMEGQIKNFPCCSLEDELKNFNDYHAALGSNNFTTLPSDDFCGLQDYIDYLRDEMQVASFDVEVNGGAQFRRMMLEAEIFLRFSEIAVETKKRDVIQARGVALTSLTWRDVVVKLLGNEAHQPLKRRVRYVGERLKWFFQYQKEPTLEFMDGLEGTPAANVFSPLYPKYAKLIKQNEMIRKMIFDTYDKACERNLASFVSLFESMLTSTFSNPWVFLKCATPDKEESDNLEDTVLPSFDDTKERIPTEISGRSGVDTRITKWLSEIPEDPLEIDEAVDKVQMLVLKTYSFIRSQVCDQVELFAESFFKLPMLRRLEEDMAAIELSEEDAQNYQSRRERLEGMIQVEEGMLKEVNWCIERLNNFKLKCEAEQF